LGRNFLGNTPVPREIKGNPILPIKRENLFGVHLVPQIFFLGRIKKKGNQGKIPIIPSQNGSAQTKRFLEPWVWTKPN